MSCRRLIALASTFAVLVLSAATAVSWGSAPRHAAHGSTCRAEAAATCHGAGASRRAPHHRRARRVSRHGRRARRPATATATPSSAPITGAEGPVAGAPAVSPASLQDQGPAGGPTPSPAPASPAPAHLQVTAHEFSFTLSRPAVVAGPVIVQFVNGGQDPHNLHLAPADGGADAGAFSLTQPGVRSNQTFELGPGTYTFLCSLPNHQVLGMSATLIVN